MDSAGVDAEVVYTGLMQGEKLHEELFGAGESDQRPVHPLVSHVAASPFDSLSARALDPWADASTVAQQLRTASVPRLAAGNDPTDNVVGIVRTYDM